MEKLNQDQIEDALSKLKDWKLKDGSVYKMFTTKGFPQTMGLVTAIGALCQQFDHHPDFMTMKYSTVEVAFSTHSVKGITEKDINIAKEIDSLNF